MIASTGGTKTLSQSAFPGLILPHITSREETFTEASVVCGAERALAEADKLMCVTNAGPLRCEIQFVRGNRPNMSKSNKTLSDQRPSSASCACTVADKATAHTRILGKQSHAYHRQERAP